MIAWKLHEIMEKKGLTGKELALRVDRHANTIYRMRDSKEMPSLDGKLLNELCNVLDCDLSDLVEYIPDNRKANNARAVVSESERSSQNTATAIAAAVSAAQAIGSSDPSLAAKVAAQVMHVLDVLNSEISVKPEQ